MFPAVRSNNDRIKSFNYIESPTSSHLSDDLVAQIHAELSSSGESNIVSVDANGNSYVACGSFNGTLTMFGITSSNSDDILVIHQSEGAELQAFAVEVDGDSECLRVVDQGDNQSIIVGWFEGTLNYRNTSIEADGKAGFALKINHTSGEVLNHYVVDSSLQGQSDYLYGVDVLVGGGAVVVGSSKETYQIKVWNKPASCTEICGIVAVLNNSLGVQEFTYVSGNKGVVAKDVAQHTVTDTLLVVGNYLDDLQFEGSSISAPSTNGKADIFIAKYVMGQGWENSLTIGGAEADIPHSITKEGTHHFISAQVTPRRKSPKHLKRRNHHFNRWWKRHFDTQSGRFCKLHESKNHWKYGGRLCWRPCSNLWIFSHHRSVGW